MRITLFGATGRTGGLVAEQAMAAGHEVTAVVRDPARLPFGPGPLLRVAVADVMDPASIVPALDGADLALNTVGSRSSGPTTVMRDSVASIVEAMHKAGQRRLVHVSGSIAAHHGDSPYLTYLIKPVARRTFLRNAYTDLRASEDLIVPSGLDWTIFRPPALTAKPARGKYRTAIGGFPPHAFAVTRGDLAACMVSYLGDDSTIGAFIGVAN